MAQAQNSKQAKLFAAYISQRKILIADTSSASRAGLARTLVTMGAKTPHMILCTTYDNAVEEIAKHNPHVVICDYDLGSQCGLNLLQEQRKKRPEAKDCLFILVTGNTSQSAVAQAAEEDIDAYVLKPYTLEQLRNSVMKVAIEKINPSPYKKLIDEGKALLFDGKSEEAIEKFKEAQQADPKPALACFYIGQAEIMKELLEEAQTDYDKGLGYNKIHYKCLTGLYELFMQKKSFKDAYQVVKRISRYFPANPERLTGVLRLAVMTQSYEDIERYYQNFIELDARNDDLVRYICAALVVCGKYYLIKNFSSRAVELFTKASVTAAGRTKILREIITALADNKMPKEAEKFLAKFPPDTRTKEDFLTMQLLVQERLGAEPGKVIEIGRKVISAGIEDPVLFEVVIRSALKAGLEDYAEELLNSGCQKWPPYAKKLKATFEDSPRKSKETQPEKEEGESAEAG